MNAYSAHREDDDVSIEDFLSLPEEDAYRLELVRGRVVREAAPGGRHGEVCMLLAAALHNYANPRQMGRVLINTAFVLDRDMRTVRVPDFCFMTAGRFSGAVLPESVLEGAPDLAIEVLSPSNRAGEMRAKVVDYMRAGSSTVWVVDPRRRTLTVHSTNHRARTLTDTDELHGEPVLPGFRMRIADVFASSV